MLYDSQRGILWRAFVWVSWCLLGMACSDHALPVEQVAEEAPRVASLPKQPAQQTAPASADWTAEVQQRMANGERAIRADGTNVFRVMNRKQGLTAKVDSSGGLHVEPRAGGGLEVHVQLASVGREGAAQPVGVTSVALGACASDGAVDEMGACLKRLEVQRGGVIEWWESRENGLEQGFVLENRPAGRGLLELRVAIEGAQVEVAGEHATGATLRVDERTAWSYAGLSVVDARGKALESWMERDDAGGIRIVVDDEDAAYPVVVDPVLRLQTSWLAFTDQAYAQMGYSVASAGDVNGDGYGDVIVGAPYYDNGQTDEGRAYVYLGSASGLVITPAWMDESHQANAHFGTSVASAGDVNGDGYSDVIIGAPYYDNNGQTDDEGRVYVYLGSASGLEAAPAWMDESLQANAHFGTSVASAGDVNGDGYSDVIIGAPDYDNGQTDEGYAYVYLGSASGLATMAAWTAESNQADANFGTSVASAGDVNGDGYSDVIIGAPNYDNGQTDEGRAYVYLGSAAGISSSAAWTNESNQDDRSFGWSVASAGDVNGDGYSDVIVGEPGWSAPGKLEAGAAYVFLGNATALQTEYVWGVNSGKPNGQFGWSVASAGDVNGDGFGDVIVGAPTYDNEGAVLVYLGGAAGPTASAISFVAGEIGAQTGCSVASAGDVNGDGFGDVIVGIRQLDFNYVDTGLAIALLGGLSDLPQAASWTMESNQAFAQFGFCVARAGDVNGDGFDDVIVGAPGYDDGETNEGRAYVYLGSATGLETTAAWTTASDQVDASFGWSVASAGDVNGDGYGDVIVGAYLYDNGQSHEGRAYVYLGSANGLLDPATNPPWTAESDQASAYFGWSVASAGDVNGDGYGDVIVGAPGYDNGQPHEGLAYVYLGSATGLQDPTINPPWTQDSDQADAEFGNSVASAGDVNGDGYGDVIVGAAGYDNGETDEGRAYVYLGSASGLATTAAWSAESDQATALFGASVASAGDVNGDGFGDVIVGAPGYDNGQPHEGLAYVYLGSATGLQDPTINPPWTQDSDQADAEFGASVASAGDVNGDGYGDVIVGAPGYDKGETDEGRAYVYLGSAMGLDPGPAWTAESNQLEAYFGTSVMGAGDVNGDGIGDVIVGAYGYDGTTLRNGRAFVYSIRSAGRPNLRVADPILNQPIAPWGGTIGGSIRTSARSVGPFGRMNVKAEVEVKPLIVPFNGLGTTLSSTWLPSFSSGAFEDLVTDVSGLPLDTPHHVRIRFRYRPSDGRPAVASRWIYAPLSGDAHGVHFRTGLCSNGVVEGNEACDDGNVVPSDGCNAACKLENGIGCTPNAASACSSGFCVDGVCCDRACTGLCSACTAQLKGSGVDGECGYFAEGTDPEDDCATKSESTCQQDGQCDGSGACRLWASGTSCGADLCIGNASKQSFCDGRGTCLLDLVGIDCGAYGCDPATGQCITGCTTDTDCTADAYCEPSTNQCTPKATLGTACTASTQCQSGHCTDGVCCNEACDGTCRACGQDGLCGVVTAGTADAACAPDPMKPCDNTGLCTDAGACALAASGTVCAEPSCSSGMAQSSSCDGSGTCIATTTPCGDYACGPTSCNTQCTTNQDCTSGAYCDNGQCKPDTSLGKTCTANDDCSSGHCIDTGEGSKVCCESDCASDACLPNRCNAAGSCISKSLNCSPYQCANVTSCKTSCSGDADCLSGYECRGHECGVTTCDATKKCLEDETCDANTQTCIAANTPVSSCSCQVPGSRSEKRWQFASLAFVLLLLRRARSRAASSRRAS